ncbi:MAG TPA: cytochrome P450 [Mycobacteriales bacterium]|nr:cytochrome P450 [Mycobacteriales bacterium]
MTASARLGWPLSVADPYDDYRRLRDEGPICRLPEIDVPLVVGHDLASEVLAGADWSSDPSTSARLVERFGAVAPVSFEFGSILMSDPPRHTWLRKAVSGYFTPRNIERIRDRVGRIVDLALGGLGHGGAVDVMDEVAYPVPIAVMCELLGAPAAFAPRLRDETPRLVATLDPLADAPAIEAGAAAALSLMFELVALVAERRALPGDDLISALLDEEAGLPSEEVIPLALILLAAGHETTANLVGGAVVALHDHPDVARAARADRRLLPVLVEELVRYDGPVQLASRIATTDRLVAGLAVGAGEQVLVGLGAANRDPAVFGDPDSIRLDRSTPHVGFGHGRHFCLGAALARLEVSEIVARLLDLPVPLEDLDIHVRRGQSATFRRVESLLIES